MFSVGSTLLYIIINSNILYIHIYVTIWYFLILVYLIHLIENYTYINKTIANRGIEIIINYIYSMYYININIYEKEEINFLALYISFTVYIKRLLFYIVMLIKKYIYLSI